MVNKTIQLNPCDLHQPLEAITPRFAASYRVKFVRVPQDVQDPFVRVFKADGQGYFDCPCNADGNGDLECYMLGTCFPAVCRSFYEVHGRDGEGNPCALGRGALIVEPFSVGGDPVEAGTEITIATLPDRQGRLHRVLAVNIGTAEKPDWTWEVLEVVSGSGPLAGTLPDATGALHQVRAVDLGTGELVPETATVDGTGDKVL